VAAAPIESHADGAHGPAAVIVAGARSVVDGASGLQAIGCTCLDIDITTSGDLAVGIARRTIKGLDPDCPVHTEPDPTDPAVRQHRTAP
jgi:hypothetical protein